MAALQIVNWDFVAKHSHQNIVVIRNLTYQALLHLKQLVLLAL